MRPWVVSSLALAALARATAIYVSHDKESLINSTRRDQPSPRSSYNLVEHHSGNTFFDGFDFFTGADPTGGYTAYQSQSSAVQKGLAYVQSDGKAVIRVDSWTTLNSGQNRDSVRIESQSSYDTGLMIFDVANMPWGCSVWPALWTNGPNWPYDGEIDVIEGVNQITKNQMTLHTGPDTSCNTQGVTSSQLHNSNPLGTKCASTTSSNAGCGFQDSETSSFGSGFNGAGGAVFALLIESGGIKIWRFPRSNIPGDITAQNPNPGGWGNPSAYFPDTPSCAIVDNVHSNKIILNISICGGWARDAFSQSGCRGVCSDRVSNPSNYIQALWKINSVSVYQ